MRPLPPRHAVWIALMVVVLWALWAAYFNTAQFGDNVEQFNWAQSLELGYHKHPPLPSWVLAAVIKLFGPSVYWAYVLSTLCLLGTASFTWLIGRELLGERVAAAAVVLWGLNITFSQRAQLYNHNTVLVMCIAATVWCAMQATRLTRSEPAPAVLRPVSGALPWLWWAATGAMAGAAVLSKYQALVPLAGLLLALVGSGRIGRRVADWGGLMLAMAILLLVCAPHAIWVTQHDFSTLRYAADAIEEAGMPRRFGFIVSFFANQVRLWFPPLLTLGLLWAWQRRWPRTAAPAETPLAVAPRDFRIWMWGLVWGGVIVLMVMALAGGVSLRNHWGVQVLQFFCLWLALRWDSRWTIDLRRLVCVALAVHAVSLGVYAGEHVDPSRTISDRRIDTTYPARRLARAAVRHWTATTECPLRYVAGTVFDSGLVSLYSGGHLEVFDNESATPWISPEELRRHGALYVLDADDPVPPGLTHIVSFELRPGALNAGPKGTIKLGVMLPQQPCK